MKLTEVKRIIMERVQNGEPLDNATGLVVNEIIRSKLMHVTPTYTPGEVCPYRLTEKGRMALKDGEYDAGPE